ncbi:MAG: phosphosulfolactate synthase [Bacillota bacterium]|nr:phosphosulfolactate synthase [Bacillota bacterium]
MNSGMDRAWDGVIAPPIEGRLSKPRSTGITMVLDKGLGVTALHDLLETAADWVDFWKFTFGTSVMYPRTVLEAKVRLLHKHGVFACPGGTLFEVAWMQQRYDAYLNRLMQLGFGAIEISDGTYPLSLAERQEAIRKAKSLGLKVLSEVGKKDPGDSQPSSVLYDLLRSDFEAGVDYVIVEGRESGKGVGIYDAKGEIIEEDLGVLSQDPQCVERILWEAPLKSQQVALIKRFGCNVNLGNIPTEDLIALEALRTGLRGDTLRDVVRKRVAK